MVPPPPIPTPSLEAARLRAAAITGATAAAAQSLVRQLERNRKAAVAEEQSSHGYESSLRRHIDEGREPDASFHLLRRGLDRSRGKAQQLSECNRVLELAAAKLMEPFRSALWRDGNTEEP